MKFTNNDAIDELEVRDELTRNECQKEKERMELRVCSQCGYLIERDEDFAILDDDQAVHAEHLREKRRREMPPEEEEEEDDDEQSAEDSPEEPAEAVDGYTSPDQVTTMNPEREE